jgi:hypothetical protein
VCLPHLPLSKSREIGSRSPAGRFDSGHTITVPGRRAQAPGLPYSVDAFSARKSDFPSPLAGCLPCSGAPPVERHRRASPPHALRLICCLYNRREIGDCRFDGFAFDSAPGRRPGRRERLVAVRAPTVAASRGSILKYLIKTTYYPETSITIACYLCNTLGKRGAARWFEAVPLLRVQKSSVIVIGRRRGASRGRPVLGGSLKSLAFMRECPKARSD